MGNNNFSTVSAISNVFVYLRFSVSKDERKTENYLSINQPCMNILPGLYEQIRLSITENKTEMIMTDT